MKKRVLNSILLVIFIMTMIGCSSKDKVKEDIKDNVSSTINNEKKDNENATNEKNIEENDDVDEYMTTEDIMEYAQANYFNKRYSNVASIVYYDNDNVYEFDIDSKEGKKIFELIKKRFVCAGEHVSKDVSLKGKVEEIKKSGKAVEVKFNKEYLMGTEPHENTNYKSIAIKCDSWFFPLEGEYENYFTYLPKSEYTFEKIGDAKVLRTYLEGLDSSDIS